MRHLLSQICVHLRRARVNALRDVSARVESRRGLLVAGLVLGTASFAASATVDLFVTSNFVAAQPGDRKIATFVVGNQGASSTSGIQLTVVTGPYVNIDRGVGLPAGCAFLYQNLDRAVPEIVACILPGLAAGAQESFSLGMAIDDRAPGGQLRGLATVLPVEGSSDIEADPLTNIGYPTIAIGRSILPTGRTNLAVSADGTAIGGSTPGVRTLVVTNNGPDTTAGPSVLILRTGAFLNVDHGRPLPSGCQMLYTNANPGVPEIVQCVLPAGIVAGTSREVRLPLALVSGGPRGTVLDSAAVRSDETSGDADPSRHDNVFDGNVSVLGPNPGNVPIGGSLPVALVLPPPLASAPAPAVPVGTGAAVDLNIAGGQQAVLPGGLTTQVLTIGNTGASATGAIRLVYTLPLFVRVDRDRPLPGVCVFLFQGTDFTVQDIVECTMPAVAHDQTRTLAIPLIVSPTAPRGAAPGVAIVQPAPDSADAERFLRNNIIIAALRVLAGPAVPLPPGHPVDLYLTVDVFPNTLTNRAGTQTLVVTNRGPEATQGVTRVTFATPLFVNVDRSRAWPVGCSFLYENADLAVPEVVECLIDAPIPAGSQVRLPIPVRMVPGAPAGVLNGGAVVRPQAGSPDVEQSPSDNTLASGVVASELPSHPIRFFLHTNNFLAPAGGFTMTPTPASGMLSVNLLNAPRWFSVPALVGSFDPEAQFRVVTPCLLGLDLAKTYRLSTTALDGSDERPLGQASVPLSLCAGQRSVTVPVLAPIALDDRRLKLTVQTLVGVTLPLGSNTYLEGTTFRGTP